MADDGTGMRVADEAGMGRLEIFPLPADEITLRNLLTELFTEYWSVVRFGSMIQGAVFEIAAPCAPCGISMLDGYLTVDFGQWHFHLCIGEHHGSRRHPTPPALARHRRTARAEFYRDVSSGAPTSWGLRLLNGAGEQQLTVFLPNPFLSDEMGVLQAPDWNRLAAWDTLRKRYLGLVSDPRDRTAKAFVHP